MVRTSSKFALLMVACLCSTAAMAQVATDKPAASPLPPSTASEEFQGLSCLAGGGFAAVGAWIYSEMFVAAAAAGPSAPLVAPIVATAFVTSCGVGSVLSPGLQWIYRRLG